MKTQKTEKRIKKKIFPAIVIAFIAVTLGIGYRTSVVLAVFDAGKTVRMADSEIGKSTLAIGTHLVYLGAMDEQVYEIAMQSANESGQKNIYYKSELAGGAWYNITDASSLADISTAGKPVAVSVIEALKFNYYTKEDGLTYDLNSNKGICIFDISDPYNLETMPELESLKDQYLLVKKKTNKNDSDKYMSKLIDEFYGLELQTNETKKVDEQLAGLQAYFNSLVSSSASLEKRSAVHRIMSKIDAKRRALIYKKMYELTMQNLIKNMQGSGTQEIPENYMPNPDLLSGASSALGSMQESYMTYSNQMLAQGNTILGDLEYDYIEKLIRAATDGDLDSCERYVDKLCSLYNIGSGIVVNEKKELKLIEDELLDAADSAYMNQLGSGEGADYKAAITNSSSLSVLSQLLKVQQNHANGVRSQLQFIIKSKVNRMTNVQGQEFIKKRIEEAQNFKQAIKTDAYEPFANESCEQYIKWLNGLLKNMVEKSPEGSDMEKLLQKKSRLIKDKQEALDKNDLAGAKKIDVQIDVVATDIEKLEQQLSVIMVSPTSSDSEKAIARASLGAGTVAGDIASITDNILDYIEEGNLSGATDALDGIASLMEGNKEAAMDALTTVGDALAAAGLTSGETQGIGDGGSVSGNQLGEVKQALDQVKELITQNADMLLGNMSEEGIDLLLMQVYGSDFFGLAKESEAAVLIAMSRYVSTTKDKVVENLLITRAQMAYEEGNQYLYPKLETESDPYASVLSVSRCTNYRYIFSDTQQKAILQKGGAYYSFSAFRTSVKRSAMTDLSATKDTDDSLSSPAGFQGYVYIPADYVNKQFHLTAEYLQSSDYSVLATQAILEEAENVLDQLYSIGK